MEDYVLGKRVLRNRPTSAFASRSQRALPVKEAVQADFIAPPSSIHAAAAPLSSRQRRPSIGPSVTPLRKTAVALDPVTRIPLSRVAGVQTEFSTEREYTSFSSKQGPAFGPRPASAFKPFALGSGREHTELCDAPKGFAEEVVQKASRTPQLSARRSGRQSSSCDRADKWLRPSHDDVPGPGAYFVP